MRAQREGSEHSKAADELRGRMEKMEAEIYSRSRQLEEMNRQRLEAIGRLAGGVAHDFNNLLGVILGYSRLLAERLPENGSFRGGLEKIEHAAESAASLTRQLLAFSRRQILEPKVIDLNQVVADVEPLIRRVIGADITFETNLASSLWNVKADPAQVEQVIMNLALNARDAMPDGGRLVIETSKAEIDEKYIQRRPTVPPGHYTMLSVADTGSGIPLEVQAHIFEPFFTTKEKGKGTGLGLATVYGIVKQSGGHVWVYSEPGMGTAFRIYLPATEATAEITNQRVTSSPRLQGSETILVVDDHADLRDLAGLILKAIRICSPDGGYSRRSVAHCAIPFGPDRSVAHRRHPARHEWQNSRPATARSTSLGQSSLRFRIHRKRDRAPRRTGAGNEFPAKTFFAGHTNEEGTGSFGPSVKAL